MSVVDLIGSISQTCLGEDVRKVDYDVTGYPRRKDVVASANSRLER